MPTSAAATPSGSVTIPCTHCARWNRVDLARAGAKCGACGTAISLDAPLHLDDTSFERVIAGSTIPVLVDFYADWCAPCKMMAPAVDQLARGSAGSALIAKLDTEAAPHTAQRFQIRGIPTVIVFRNGAETRRHSGAMPLSALRSMLG